MGILKDYFSFLNHIDIDFHHISNINDIFSNESSILTQIKIGLIRILKYG